MRNILYLRQGIDKPTEAYNRIFEAEISTDDMEKCNATTQMEPNKAYADGDDEDGTKRFQEMCLIVSVESDWYSGIWNNLNSSTLLGTYNYPKTTTAAYDVMCRYKELTPPRQVRAPPEAVKFVQSGDAKKNKTSIGNDGRSFPEVTCYFCQEIGHYAGNLPSSTANTRTVSQPLYVGTTMDQTMKYEPTTNIIDTNFILLYACSTISHIRNKNIVQNIQHCDAGEELRAHINGGHQDYDHTSTLKMLPF